MAEQEPIKYYPTQATIVRQSQLKMALDICSSRGIIPSVTELQRITDVLCDAVMQEPNQTLKNRIKKLDDWLDSKTVKNEKI